MADCSLLTPLLSAACFRRCPARLRVSLCCSSSCAVVNTLRLLLAKRRSSPSILIGHDLRHDLQVLGIESVWCESQLLWLRAALLPGKCSRLLSTSRSSSSALLAPASCSLAAMISFPHGSFRERRDDFLIVDTALLPISRGLGWEEQARQCVWW